MTVDLPAWALQPATAGDRLLVEAQRRSVAQVPLAGEQGAARLGTATGMARTPLWLPKRVSCNDACQRRQLRGRLSTKAASSS